VNQDLCLSFQPKTVVVYPLKFSGKSFEEKLFDLRAIITKSGAASMVVSEPDEIAWLFNLRGEGE
jgi:Xaa-Pro aminopeptidase